MSKKSASSSPMIRYLYRCIGYESMIAVLATIVVYSAGSSTAAFPLLVAVGGVFCLWLMLYTMRAAAKGDVNRYPYGTGRLENVSAISLALLIGMGSVILFLQALQELWKGNIHAVQMGWTFLLLLISALGNGLNAVRASQLRRGKDTPILSSLYHMYFAGMVRDASSSTLIGIFWLLKSDNPTVMSRLDSLATLILALYSLYHFIPQIWINFRALADFPLDESAQLKIMAILGRHFEAYEMPGHIFSTHRGNTPVLEVELEFHPSMTLEKLLQIEESMRQDFHQDFPDCIFRIMPISTRK